MAASALSRRFASAREQWGVLAQTGAWLLAVICTFVLPPPAGGEGAGKGTTEAFTAFFVAVLVGLMYVPVTRWRGHRYLRRWLAVTVASLATGTAAYVVYDHLRAEWTVPYDETRVTRGKTYTALAQQHRAADPSVSDADLVEFAGGISGRLDRQRDRVPASPPARELPVHQRGARDLPDRRHAAARGEPRPSGLRAGACAREAALTVPQEAPRPRPPLRSRLSRPQPVRWSRR